MVIWQSRTSHVVTEGTLGGVSAGCKPLQTMPKMAMATLNGGFRATVLTTPCWPSQLPLEEAHAPQAKGMNERYRHGEAPTVADAVIETKKGNTRCSLDLHMRSCHSYSSIEPL